MEGGPRNSTDGKNLSAEAGVIPRSIRQIFDALECNEVRVLSTWLAAYLTLCLQGAG